MKLRLYHGSNSRFNHFKIAPSLSNYSDDTALKEGYGIYLTSDKQLAERYGNYLYEVHIDSNDITDFTKEETIRNVIRDIETSTNIPISLYIDVKSISENVLRGWEPVVTLGVEITKILDNNEAFITEYDEMITDEEDCIYQLINKAYMLSIKDVLKYPDNDFDGDIYICHRNPHRLQIVKLKENK